MTIFYDPTWARLREQIDLFSLGGIVYSLLGAHCAFDPQCDLGDEERERANAVERIQLLELQRGGCLRERRRLVEWAICLGLCR